MIFEGSEKKIEVIVDQSIGDLRKKGDEFWSVIVEACNAEIISSIKNDEVHAYLLSESSLFVWENSFLMITCGKTSLVKSLLKVMAIFGKENIVDVIFQRKNEYFGHMQFTSFYEDIKLLSELRPAGAWRLGDLDGHHNFVFNYSRDKKWETQEETFEFLMYNIGERAGEWLRTEGRTALEIREFLGVEELLPGYIVDDFAFQPYGYSLNAIKGEFYYTIHLSPELNGSYISFETNDEEVDPKKIIARFTEQLRPKSYDVITFNFEDDFTMQTYMMVEQSQQKLDNGLNVQFLQFIDNHNTQVKPGFPLL